MMFYGTRDGWRIRIDFTASMLALNNKPDTHNSPENNERDKIHWRIMIEYSQSIRMWNKSCLKGNHYICIFALLFQLSTQNYNQEEYQWHRRLNPRIYKYHFHSPSLRLFFCLRHTLNINSEGYPNIHDLYHLKHEAQKGKVSPIKWKDTERKIIFHKNTFSFPVHSNSVEMRSIWMRGKFKTIDWYEDNVAPPLATVIIAGEHRWRRNLWKFTYWILNYVLHINIFTVGSSYSIFLLVFWLYLNYY